MCGTSTMALLRGSRLTMRARWRCTQAGSSGSLETAGALLRGMLQRKPEKRLGYGSAQEIKDHKNFAKYGDWSVVLQKKIKPEFKPPSRKPGENFDEEFTREKAEDSLVVQHMTAAEEEQAKFDGFTFDKSGAAAGGEEE